MDILIKKIADIPNPSKQTPGSAGYDLYAAAEKTIKPGTCEIVPTGLILEIPFGFEAQIRSRSGLAFKNKVVVLNSPGTIDSDYRQEVGVLLFNHGNESFKVEKHMRIAQMVFAKVEYFEFKEMNELNQSERSGGWGSTGK